MVLCSTVHIAIARKDKADSYVKKLRSIVTVYEQCRLITRTWVNVFNFCDSFINGLHLGVVLLQLLGDCGLTHPRSEHGV